MTPETHTNADYLLEKLESSGKKYDIEKIKSAYEYAAALHEGQFRVSGEPYISHPVAVAEIVAELGLDTDSICAALLHDTVEDCADRTDLADLEKKFGAQVAMLVDGLTKIVQVNVEDKEEAHVENIRKMLLAMSRDIRVIFIKLCDRLHNMRTLGVKKDAKRRVTALETMQVYAPLAHRLGIQKIKQELENISISYLDPIGYDEVQKDIERKYGLNQGFMESVKSQIEEKLKENGIHYTLKGRIKSAYSIYRKMYSQNKSFDEIYDFYAVRIIVDTELECYTTLGLIHEMFKSVPGRFKDYISTPKPNMYRSLHTTVIGRDGIPFEVQIRTWEMHHVAEYGVAAHWKYKSGEKAKESMDEKLEWVSRLVETESSAVDPDEFMSALKTDIFQDEVFVFTPKGDVIALPQGSTVIDFAYAIHTAVGNKMVGAKINGMIVPIDRSPKNGEIVEILTSANSKGPSRDWLKIVKTSEARNKIRQWFKKEQRTDNIALGREMVMGELRHCGRKFTEEQFDEICANVAQRNGFMIADDMFNTLGYGGMPISKLAVKLRDEFDRVVKPEVPEPTITEVEQVKLASPQKHKHGGGGIVVDGQSGCAVKFAKCCNPLPGDKVIGFITKGFGISIHKADCPNVAENRKKPEYVDRFVNAHWEDGAQTGGSSYEALLQIFARPSPTLLADVSMAMADMKVAILAINMQKKSDEMMIMNMTIGCKNIDHYESIVSRLRGLRDVTGVERGFS